MRKMYKAKTVLILFAAFFLFAGLDFWQDVELNYNKPLIDLYGNDSEENPFTFSEEVNDTETNISVEEAPKETGETRRTQDRHIVGVKYKTVTWDGRECTEEELENRVRSSAAKDTLILLWDNYAEYHCYVSIKNRLEKLKEEKGFVLTEKVLGETP